jgi:glutathione S-transferase
MLHLFDMAGRDPALRFSPFCWRTKMALLHKGLDFETTPWRFTDKDIIKQTGQGRVPVLVDGAETVHDSWTIALYLDRTYPDRPALMVSDRGRAAAHFLNSWCDLSLHANLRALLFLDVFEAAAEQDRAYFRESRERLVGQRLEQFCGNRPAAVAAFRKTLQPAELTLQDSKHFGGAAPDYSDYVLFGSLQWARTISGTPFLDDGTAISAWFERMLDLFGGYGRQAPMAKQPTAA